LEEISGKKTWTALPEDFCHYLSFAIGGCSNNMSRPILTCVNINKDGTMDSSDGFKVLRCNTGEALLVDTFLIPAHCAMEVIKIKPTQVAESDGWAHFKNKKGTVLSCRTFLESFPDVSHLLSVEGIEATFPKSMEEIVERAHVFAERNHILDESIEITLGDNKIHVKAQSETGWIEESANMRYKEATLTFNITPYLLLDILKETATFIIADKKIKFEGAGWEYISMLRNV